MRKGGDIYAVEYNVRGAVVIYGSLGVRQYYYYTKKQAMAAYREECRHTLFYNEPRRLT